MALLEGQKMISNIDFRDHISTLQAENTPTSCICKEKIIPKQLPKSPENGFVDPEKGENDPLRGPKLDQLI